jgi:subtilisin-like proprotein convertase family protein
MSLTWDGPPPDPAGVSAALEVSPFSPEETFRLHSRPGSTKFILLDFDGHTTSDTPWNDPNPDEVGDEIPTIVTPPYSIDLDGTFTDAELLNIQQIWERVSEDFRPFDVDVTTEDPGATVLGKNGIRIAIGGSNDVWYGKSAGGVAMLGGFASGKDVPAFVFEDNVGNGNPKSVAEAVSHEAGHTLGLHHDGLFVLGQDDPTEYYPGHGPGLGPPTGWAPIMGTGYDQELSQWSKGEYPNAVTMWPPEDPPVPRLDHQDDLKDISLKLPYVKDDHGNDFSMASEMEFTGTTFFAEGLIEKNSDVDFLKFRIGVEEVVFDIQPFHIGPNLDILAKLHDASGAVLATSNPRDALDAGFSINTLGGTQLAPGTYYISIDGTGKTFTTDPGYTDYGSLGYFSISGTRKSLLEVLTGIDFDAPNGTSPASWTRYTGGGAAVFSDLRNEAGVRTPYNLTINTTSTPIASQSNSLNKGSIPFHTQPLTAVGGFIAGTDATWTFTWSDLEPFTVYEIYVFASNDSLAGNSIQIAGNGNTIRFTQSLSSNELVINNHVGDSERPLSDFARTIQSTASGEIRITVMTAEGATESAISGLAIRPGTFGSISGQVWNDENGDGVKDAAESGLSGWTVFFDDNGNDKLESTFTTTTPSVDVPQEVNSYTTVKSELLFQGVREILDLNVKLDISHPHNGDVNVYLISPSGTRVELFTDVGGLQDNFTGTVLDDEAATPIASASAPFTGSFRPESALNALDGENANGVWTLEISDDAVVHSGVLNSWSLTITGSERSTVTDGNGEYTFEDLPPGVYDIKEVMQSGWSQTLGQPPVTVSSGGRVKDVNFGNWQDATQPDPSSISGLVWNDSNGDGVKDGGEPGLPDWRIYVDGNGNGQFDPEALRTLQSAAVPRAIADLSTITSEVSFNGLNAVKGVTVTLDITHSFDGDLDVFLISPAGTQVELFSGVGGQFNNFQNTTFDANAEVSITEGTAPFTDTYRPEGLLADFLNENPNGIWRLLIRDTAEGDVGTLNSWSLTIEGQELSTTTDSSGNYSFDDVAPGSYVVREVLQSGWSATHSPTAPIDVGTSQQLINVDFGNTHTPVGLPGDYNSNDVVDMVDYVLWRRSLNETVPPFSGADGDGNGVVDQDDYGVWRAHFGMAAPAEGNGTAAFVAALEASSGSSQSASVSLASAARDAQPELTPQQDAQALPERGNIARQPMVENQPEPGARLRQEYRTSPRVAISPGLGDLALMAWLSGPWSGTSDQRYIDDAGQDHGSLLAAQFESNASIDLVFDSLGRLAVRQAF